MIGINSVGSPEDRDEFVETHRLTFTSLVDWNFGPTASHYGIRVWSSFWLLDKNGARIGDRPESFNVTRIERLLADLE